MQQNNGKSPLVSVCVPTYNRAEKLSLAIKKIQEQSYGNLEIIISDNCSSDDTQSLCIKLEKEDDRIKYYRHTNNMGPTKNFEFARTKATGKYFMWHGDDDYLDKNYIKMCVDELELNRGYSLVSGLGAYIYNKTGHIDHYGNIIQLNSKYSLFRVVKYLWNVGENSIFCGVYRRSKLETCNMPNVLAGDWIWISQVLLKGKAKVIDNIFVNRSYGDNTSSSYDRIIEIIGAPKWHAKHPWFAMSKNFLSFYLKQKKFLLGIISFFVIFVKGSWFFFKRYSKLSVLKRYLKKIF